MPVDFNITGDYLKNGVPIGGGGGGIHSQIKLSSGEKTSSSITSTGFASVAASSDTLFSVPYKPAQTVVCQDLFINVLTGVASSKCRILIYSDFNGIPYKKEYESVDLDTSTTGIKTAITEFTFNQGVTYWLTIHSNSNPTLTSLSAQQLITIKLISIAPSGVINSYSGSATFGSAPYIFPTLTNRATTTPCVLITSA
jgi:hypothetical protein